MKNSTDNCPLNILYVSYGGTHDEIFRRLNKELSTLLKDGFNFELLHANELQSRPVSLKSSYVTELRTFSRKVNALNPQILVVANDQGICAAFIQICKIKGIPTVAVQDGILGKNKTDSFLFYILSWNRFIIWRIFSFFINLPLFSKLSIHSGREWGVLSWGTCGADKIAAIGEKYKRLFMSKGINPDRIVVTGYPLLDDLPNQLLQLNNPRFFKATGLPACKDLVLLITQPFVEDGLLSIVERNTFIKSVIESVKSVNSCLIIKPHPREDSDFYNIFTKNYSDIIVAENNSDLNQYLLVADVIITVSSTVGLWAMAYQKPLMVANYVLPGNTENLLNNLGATVNDPNQLSSVLNQILTDKRYKDTLIEKQTRQVNDYLYCLDGQASRRIANLILNVAKK